MAQHAARSTQHAARSTQHVVLLACALALLACAGDGGDGDLGGEPLGQTEVAFSTLGVERLIPLRIIQFTSGGGDTPLTNDELQWAVWNLNSVFKTAGVQFYLRATHLETSADFAKLRTPDDQNWEDYTWPNTFPWASTPPFLNFRPDCLPPGALGTTEQRRWALKRAAHYCAFDDEILIYVPDSGCTGGMYPWEARMISVTRGHFRDWPGHIFPHEIGHYLGLPHIFRGSGSGYDFAGSTVFTVSPNVYNPETGAQAKFSDFFDLVYLPASFTPPTWPDQFFRSAAQAHSFENKLRPVVDSDVLDQTECTTDAAKLTLCTFLGMNCSCGTHAPGTYKARIPAASGTSRWLFTGDTGMQGLGFEHAAVLGGVDQGFNVMSYVPPYPGPVTGFRRQALSPSQAAQIRRSLRFDIGCYSYHLGGTGRRNRHGEGMYRQPDVMLDFDNDGKRDMVVWEPHHTGLLQGPGFRIRTSLSTFSTQITREAGTPTAGYVATPVPGDYDRDGITDAAFFEVPTSASSTYTYWVIRKSSDSSLLRCHFGSRGDIPLPQTRFTSSTPEIALYRPSSGTWYWGRAINGGDCTSLGSRSGTGGYGREPLHGLYKGCRGSVTELQSSKS